MLRHQVTRPKPDWLTGGARPASASRAARPPPRHTVRTQDRGHLSLDLDATGTVQAATAVGRPWRAAASGLRLLQTRRTTSSNSQPTSGQVGQPNVNRIYVTGPGVTAGEMPCVTTSSGRAMFRSGGICSRGQALRARHRRGHPADQSPHLAAAISAVRRPGTCTARVSGARPRRLLVETSRMLSPFVMTGRYP